MPGVKPAKRASRIRLATLMVAVLLGLRIGGAAYSMEPVTQVDPNVVSSSGSSDSSASILSGNGRFVVFLSTAQNLTTNAFSGTVNVFLRDRQMGLTALVSVGTNGAAANGPCGSP